MVKPFSIQAPENIAKEYAGNKQRIAEAARMGVIDPTAAVLAGMFIDRMRSAQSQEGLNPPTVAQQVMGGAPPAPPAPSLPAGGLGASPPAAPPMAPPMGMPPEMGMAPPMPEAPPMGMADGGLAVLPVPDTMFDEPDNGGYAGGGIVAFADGGGIDLERLRRALLAQESGGDYGIKNKQGSPAMGGYQFMPDTARALAKRLGIEYRPDLLLGDKGRSKEGIAYQERLMDEQMKDILAFSGGDLGRAAAFHFAGPNEKGWGAKTRKYQQDILRRYSGTKDDGTLPERNVETSEGRRGLHDDMYALAKERFAGLPDSGLDELEAYYRKELDPETQRKERKEDMWMALAQLGANMAASNSPFFLQAAGEAIAATMPGVQASKKERKAAERDARKGLREVLGLERDEQKEVLAYAKDLTVAELRSEESQIERETRINEAKVQREHDFAVMREEQRNAMARIAETAKVQGAANNTEPERHRAAWRQVLLDRVKQGVPIYGPDGKLIVFKKMPSGSELDLLAGQLALKDLGLKNSGTGLETSLALRSSGGGGAQPAVVDTDYGSM